MTRKSLFGLLVLTFVLLPLFAVCGETNWWDKYGEPQYGGTITYQSSTFSPAFDTNSFIGAEYDFYYESLWEKIDWKLDRNIWSFSTNFTPEKYCAGILAESWEQPDAQTLIIHLRQGVYWQDKPPVNGREFTADDVVHHYDRVLGTGSGYTEPNPMYLSMTDNWEKVTATDKYTIVFKFKHPTGIGLMSVMDPMVMNCIEAPEYASLSDQDRKDWKNAVGTGPWVLANYTHGSSLTFSKNPNYWGYDERHPKNPIPYADELKILNIPDTATAMAALRTGKIDIMSDLSWRQAQSFAKTNPELQQVKLPAQGVSVDISRLNRAPFDDIRVRKALQMSLDLPAMAENLYGGLVDGTPCAKIGPALKGYCFAHEDWPQELKDEYSYNPKKAKELLAEAGYPNGFKTNVAISSGLADLEVIETIKSYFMDIGVDMEIVTLDFAAWNNANQTGKYDMSASTTCGTTWPPTRTVPGFYSKNPRNYAVNDPGYDAIVEKFYAALTPDEVAKITVAADRYMLEKHWSVDVFSSISFNMWQPYLKGYSGECFVQKTMTFGTTHLWASLWIDQELKKSMRR